MTTSSAYRPRKGTTLGRAEIAVNSKIEHLLTEAEPINQRIIKAAFSSNPGIFPLVVNYAPKDGSTKVEEYFKTLTNITNDITKQHTIIKKGDLNARIGNYAGKFTFYQRTNNYNKFKFQQTSECNLKIINILFKRKRLKQ